MKYNKAKIYIIFSLVVLVIAVIASGTYAYYVWNTSSSEETKIVTSIGGATVYFDGGDAIENFALRPVESKEYGIKKIVSVKSNTIGLSFNLYLDITSIDTGLKDESFRYEFYRGTNKIKEGNFSDSYLTSNTDTCSKNNTKHIVLLTDESISTTKADYTLYIWIDGENYVNPDTMMNKTFNFKLHAEGQGAILKEGKIPDITTVPESQKKSFAYKILSDYYYADKSDILSNGITYHYDPEHSLMSDIGSNVRYYGASPNNYIYFNCSDYSNQSASTCELWRIIGVFEGKIKIIRNESIGNYSWDNKNTTTGAEDARGKNDWTTARLMKLLNPSKYYTVDSNDNNLGQSLYYNSTSGKCYKDQNNATVDCNFTSTGIKNDITRNLIEEANWNLGGWNTSVIYPNQIYEYERGTTVYSGRPTTWKGKIALMYPSDYSYAADLTKCKSSTDADATDLTLGYFNSDVNDYQCRKNDWLFNSDGQWLLTPDFVRAYQVWYVNSTGYALHNRDAFYGIYGVRPVLYLNSTQELESGEGTSNNPYKLSV